MLIDQDGRHWSTTPAPPQPQVCVSSLKTHSSLELQTTLFMGASANHGL
jgi:hypothetical protein